MSIALRAWCEASGIRPGPDGRPDAGSAAARGVPLTENGLPRRAEKPGPAKPCCRCGVPVEDPVDCFFYSDDPAKPPRNVGPVCQPCMDESWADPAMPN